VTTLLERRPERLPSGYSLRYSLSDGREPGFGWVKEQTVLVYTRGWAPEDFTFPLVVCVGRAGAPDPVGTSPDHGEPLDLGVPGVEAVYHDGILSARLDGADDFAGTAWQQGSVHSVTARSATGAFAVRGPRGLERDELVATLLSLSPGE
jgi:hypothetical protein